jgi:hypothetical protein
MVAVGYGRKAEDGNQTLGGRNANELADNILTLKQGLNSATAEIKKLSPVPFLFLFFLSHCFFFFFSHCYFLFFSLFVFLYCSLSLVFYIVLSHCNFVLFSLIVILYCSLSLVFCIVLSHCNIVITMRENNTILQ